MHYLVFSSFLFPFILDNESSLIKIKFVVGGKKNSLKRVWDPLAKDIKTLSHRIEDNPTQRKDSKCLLLVRGDHQNHL